MASSSSSRRSSRKDKKDKKEKKEKSESRPLGVDGKPIGWNDPWYEARKIIVERQRRAYEDPSTASSSDAATYYCEENEKGELVNPRLGVIWPQKVHGLKKYPHHTSTASSSRSDYGEDQFASSPYEMISVADLDAAKKAKKADAGSSKSSSKSRKKRRGSRRGRARRSSRSSRRDSRRARRRDRKRDTARTPSPQYVQLSGRGEDEAGSNSDDNTGKIDSVVFNTAEELNRYQLIFAADAERTRVKKEKEEKEAKEAKEREEREKEEKEEKEREAAAAAAAAASAASSATAITSVVTQGERDNVARHYLGVRSRRSVDKKLRPGQFYIYYDKPSEDDIPVTIELKIGYMSSTSKIYHFPIQRFNCQGEPYYAVMQTDTDVKMFSSIAALVHHYHTFSHVDPETGRLETFGLPV